MQTWRLVGQFIHCFGRGLSVALALIAACSSGVDEQSCFPGTTGCACIENACPSAEEGVVCLAGRCQPVTCSTGDLGCACLEDYTCNAQTDGAPLMCMGGICEATECPQGELACPCIGAGQCDAALVCSDASGRFRCEKQDCPPGELNCACLRDNTCGLSANGETLVCDTRIRTCVESGCAPGSTGCLCKPNYGCDHGLYCQDFRCADTGCKLGAIGCACLQGGLCGDENLNCEDGLCQEEGCPAGMPGCGCRADGKCEDVAMLCVEGRCEPPDCRPGATGCTCYSDGSCDRGGTCIDGWCMAEDCDAPGEVNCPCANGECEDGAVCLLDAICANNTGYEGGACLEGERCHKGYRCRADVCTTCFAGSLACGCKEDDVCDTGLSCMAGLCVSEDSLNREVPKDPVCWTPCNDDLVRPDGTILSCGEDGLLKGCLSGTECIDGSCLPANSQNGRLCATDVDCPDFQVCIQGTCYSQCEDDGGCDAPFVCNEKSCRLPCAVHTGDEANVSAGERPCPEGLVCETTSGANGFCMPVDDNGMTGSSQDFDKAKANGLSFSKTEISFSKMKDNGSLYIINTGTDTASLHIEKHHHNAYYQDSKDDRRVNAVENNRACPPGACPLEWLEMGYKTARKTAQPEPVQSLEIRLPGRCGDAPSACTVDGDCTTSGLHGNVCGDAGVCVCDPSAEGYSESCRDFSNCTVRIDLSGASAFEESELISWEGTLSVSWPDVIEQSLNLQFGAGAKGLWSGEVFYFANFEDDGLDAWQAGQHDAASVQNALINKWGAFKNQNLSFEEFEAVLQAVETESWQYPSVQNRCDDAACYLTDRGQGIAVLSSSLDTQPVPSGTVVLPFAVNLTPAPKTSADGLSYIGKIDSQKALQYPGDPAVELRFSSDPGQCEEGYVDCVTFVSGFEAKVFAGGRYVTDASDTDCALRDDGSFAQLKFPWLPEGFTPPGYRGMAEHAPASVYECRDTLIPRTGTATEIVDANQRAAGQNPIPDGAIRRRSISLIDGVLVDESKLFLLFEESFESNGRRFSGYGYAKLKKEAMVLSRDDADGDGTEDVFEGNPTPPTRSDPQGVLGVACDETVLEETLPLLEQDPSFVDVCSVLNFDDCVDEISAMLLEGESATPATEIAEETESVHYLCEYADADGNPKSFFDAGAAGSALPNIPDDDSCVCRGGACNFCQDNFAKNSASVFNPYDTREDLDRYEVNGKCEYLAMDGICDDGGDGASSFICALGTDVTDCGQRSDDTLRKECPITGKVTYFTVDPAEISDADLGSLPCQQNETCSATLATMVQDGQVVQMNPRWQCADRNRSMCDINRANLTEGKVFYEAEVAGGVLDSMRTLTNQAFRYKLQFLGRDGTNVGFVPDRCDAVSEPAAYCYDPGQVEKLRARQDCLLSLFTDKYDDFEDPALRDRVKTYLKESLSYAKDENDREAKSQEGFEDLYAQLLILLGDDAFTKSYASRFDLAGIHTANFDGIAFEGPSGVDLSGVPGYEMTELYKAAQYYQKVLERFYQLVPALWKSLDFFGTPEQNRNLIQQEMVTTYIGRVVRASTQRARVFSEAAERYQNFGQSPLARTVVERAYASAYMESQVLSRFLLDVTDALAPSKKLEVRYTMDQNQRMYNIALLNMREAYEKLRNEINYFGYTNDYIPFPALDNSLISLSQNAFDELSSVVSEKISFAAEREDDALESNRAFDTDSERFKAELGQIRNSFENQLSDICGTFEMEIDGQSRAFPLIPAFSQLNPDLAAYGDPCGMGDKGGRVQQAVLEVERAHNALDQAVLAQKNTARLIENKMESMSKECNLILGTADLVWEINGAVNSLNRETRWVKFGADSIATALNDIKSFVLHMKCGDITGATCVTAAATGAAGTAIDIITQLIQKGAQIWENVNAGKVDGLNQKSAYLVATGDCEMAQVKYRGEIFKLALDLETGNLKVVDAMLKLKETLAAVEGLRTKASRLMKQRESALQSAVNVAAAKNDPNIRIYRNDAYYNADLAFYDALRGLYRLTKIYEYYTSRSYARLDELYLIRLAKRGEYNLENYYVTLINAFAEFQETFGLPDMRVATISTRDDILRVEPLDNAVGRTRREVFREFRARLSDDAYLDVNGYIVLPFSTLLESLSPLTRNHKILYVEAELQGDDSALGDDLGRVYLRQIGTGVVQSVEEDKRYYAFDERSAVMDVFVNGRKPYDPRIYRSYRLRDRPFVNTQWELVLNKVDESVNADIDFNGLTDIVLYVYYTDFTAI